MSISTESSHYKQHIFVCTNQKDPGKKCCANTGGEPYFDYLAKKLKAAGLSGPGQIRVSQSGCLGRCSLGPCLVIYPEGVWYTYTSTDDLDDIVETHLLEEKRCIHLLMHQKNN
ncbi:MAG: (2Fe-2S) ferredoxin domain-containing protein [Legionellaceae bacterium]|nr:(2Fe-2S) ferredoxin domain-containing protein [Legionellaceae bacterium]